MPGGIRVGDLPRNFCLDSRPTTNLCDLGRIEAKRLQEGRMLFRAFTLELNVPQVHRLLVESRSAQQCHPRLFVPMLPIVVEIGNREQMCQVALLLAEALYLFAEADQTLLQKRHRPRTSVQACIGRIKKDAYVGQCQTRVAQTANGKQAIQLGLPVKSVTSSAAAGSCQKPKGLVMQHRGSRHTHSLGELAERELAWMGLVHEGSGWRSGGMKQSLATGELRVSPR